MGLLEGTTQASYYQGDDFGNYQFISLEDIINQFMVVYVGEEKIISKARRTDVAFHAQRALAEMSYDTFKSIKSQEIVVPASLKMILPQDYVNYVKLSWSDGSGVEHIMYPISKTSNPTKIVQDSDGDYDFNEVEDAAGVLTNREPYAALTGILKKTVTASVLTNSAVITLDVDYDTTSILPGYRVTPTATGDSDNPTPITTHVLSVDSTANTVTVDRLYTADDAAIYTTGTTFKFYEQTSTTWDNYKSATPDENQSDDYRDDIFWPSLGERYGLEPEYSQVNGSFFIDEKTGYIHFSSNINDKTVILRYISAGLGTDAEMQVHKFAEEAMYKWISHAILSTKANVPEYVVARYKKERYAAVRAAKLRLSNIKLEEITQILKGKAKPIKR